MKELKRLCIVFPIGPLPDKSRMREIRKTIDRRARKTKRAIS
jgi:hypothetical protein